MPKPKTADPASYEAALEELEQLVGRIESGQMPLDQLLDAYRRALSTDPVSAFGGIIAFNRPLTVATVVAFMPCSPTQLDPQSVCQRIERLHTVRP